MKQSFKLFGETAIGCPFVVSNDRPLTVKVDQSDARSFSAKIADRIKHELELGGDVVKLIPQQ